MTKLRSIGGSGWGCLFPFWLFWTLLVGVFNVVLISGVTGQLWSYTFIPVQAELLERKLEEKSDGDGDTYQPRVRYKYVVAGRTYEAKRLRFLYIASSNRERAVAALPPQQVGEKLTAYHSRNHPETAVLQRGLDSMVFMLPLFLLPFNAVSLVGVLLMLDARRSKKLGRPWLAIRVRETDFAGTQIRFYSVSPPAAVIVGAGAAGFLLTFAVMIPPDTWVPFVVKLSFAWSIVLIVVVAAWRWARRSGTVLELNQFRDSLSYLAAGRSAQLESFALDQLEAIAIERRWKTDSDGDRAFSAVVALLTKAGRSLPLTTQTDARSSEQTAAWLAERLRLEVRETGESRDAAT